MDDDREVLHRLDRIERLDQAGAPAAELLDEVRALLHAAERLARSTADEDLDRNVAAVHQALEAGGAHEDLTRGAAAEGRQLVTALDRSA